MRRGDPVTPPKVFSVVKNGHVLPRVLQAQWAVGDQAEVRRPGTARSFKANIDNVGTRSRAYRRCRPNGDEIDDTEWSLSHIESAVGPVLREVAARWPLSLDEKATLAEFVAVQIVRGPRWWADREQMVRAVAADALRDGLAGPDGVLRAVDAVEVRESVGRMLDNTMRDIDMFWLSRKLCTVIASMTWTLVTFERDVLALSDHPVVLWPAGSRRWNRRGFGRSTAAVDASEIRLPLGPRAALLMTWRDAADDGHPRRGELRHARSINEPTVGQADRHWLWKPDTAPLRGSASVPPIAPMFWPTYGHAVVNRSSVRRQVQKIMQAQPSVSEPMTVAGNFSVVPASTRPR